MNDIAKQSFTVPAGRMAYIDTGPVSGKTIVFVHGNPASSAEFLPAINRLRSDHRCIAVDHIGFGDSDKPADWDYLPKSHAENFALFMDQLSVDEISLVVGDWGGPIGLSWAIGNPQRIATLVITNTWLWPVNRSLYYQGFSKMMGGPIGRYLIRNHNFFANQIVKSAWGTRTSLTPEIHRSFTDVHTERAERKGMWVFPAEIIGSTQWLSKLWDQRNVLRDLDMRIIWGMKDIAFRPDVLKRWVSEFPLASVQRLDDAGHFVALEATNELVGAIIADPKKARITNCRT